MFIVIKKISPEHKYDSYASIIVYSWLLIDIWIIEWLSQCQWNNHDALG